MAITYSTFRNIIARCLAIVLLGISANALAELPGSGISVQPIESTNVLDHFQRQVVKLGLEKLGYDVKKAKVSGGMVYETLAVAQGGADYNAAFWDPLHRSIYDRAGGDAKLSVLGVLVANVAQGYKIDERTAEKYDIKYLEQLRDPKIAKLFDKDGDGKADLIGCPPGWGCEDAVAFQMKAYGLEDTVEVKKGDYNVLRADVLANYKAGESVLYYTYLPSWLGQVLKLGTDVKWLQVKSVKQPPGESQNITTKLPDGTNTGWPVNTIRIVANKQFVRANPAAKKWFELVTIPIADVDAENLKVHNGENTEKDIRRHAKEWMKKNKKKVSEWITEAISAAN